jgi:hypothetical protein
MLVEAAWAAAKTPGPLRAFYQHIRARRGMRVAVVATARKLVTLCWHLVVKGEDYAFARPSLTDKKLCSLELRAGLPARRGQKGNAAADSLKEARRRELALAEHAEQAELAYRQLVANWQTKPPGRGVAATTGARRLGPQGAKLRGRASSPRPCSWLRGRPRPTPSLTTPGSAVNAAKALKTFIRRAQRAGQGRWDAQAQHGEGLVEPLAQAGGGNGVGLVELAGQRGQLRLGLKRRIGVVGGAHAALGVARSQGPVELGCCGLVCVS